MVEHTASRVLSRSGWDEAEISLFKDKLVRAAQDGQTLRQVFDSVACQTGRKANSVRNFYYTSIRKQMAQQEQAEGLVRRAETHFTPFTDQQIDELLETVLSAQARGMSVRACTLQMGGGDRSQMLRYQNKYRSLLRTHRSRVEEVMKRLQGQNLPCYNPYTGQTTDTGAEVRAMGRRGRRPKWEKQMSSAQNVLDGLEGLLDSEVPTLIRGIASLASKAAAREESERQTEQIRRELGQQRRQAEYYRERLLALTRSVESLLAARGESLSDLTGGEEGDVPLQ